MRVILVILAGAALAGCAPTLSEPDVGSDPQRCDAAAARSLIGSHFAAVTFESGKDVRFVCTTCSATEDYRPNRLNVRYEEATGIIRSVDCG
jgi:hypothetical protein